MDKLIFKQATQADIPVIFQESKALVDAYEDTASIDYDAVMAWMEKKIKKCIGQYQAVYCAEEKVGYFRLSQQENGTELDDFYILPAYRNQGIGREVLRYCMKAARKPVYLYVFTGNTGAIRLYQSMGFVPVKSVGQTRMIMCYNG